MAETPFLVSRHRAMATQWELLIYGSRNDYMEGVAVEVWREIDRLEEQLSFYRELSDISDLNARAAYHPVVVEPRLFRLLERARTLSELSGGAFDPSVAPLVRAWGFAGGSGSLPSEEEVEAARAVVGMQHVRFDPDASTVAFDREGVMLELGAIGKGYAVDCAIDLMREFEVESALLHGGTSTVFGLGKPPEGDAWTVAIRNPNAETDDSPLTTVALRDEALSVSAPHGKWFEAGGRRYGHVIDPLTGRPTGRTLLAALVTDSATDGDALSTALLTRGSVWLPELLKIRPEARALVMEEEEGHFFLTTHRIDPESDD